HETPAACEALYHMYFSRVKYMFCIFAKNESSNQKIAFLNAHRFWHTKPVSLAHIFWYDTAIRRNEP
ncbi:MAG: hypothetical protein IKK75_00220, partial [Clostridia bacterium]|nr:hypothetical protein [Clostridia bacterium]